MTINKWLGSDLVKYCGFMSSREGALPGGNVKYTCRGGAHKVSEPQRYCNRCFCMPDQSLTGTGALEIPV